MENRYIITLKIEGQGTIKKKVTFTELTEIEENELHNELEIISIVDLIGIA